MIKHNKKLLALFTTSVTCLIGLVVSQVYMVFTATNTVGTDSSSTITGYVGLRQYFDSGVGSETDPYVITRPSHLYNLSRLQNLGAFNTKKYFRLGKETGTNTGIYRMYGDDSSTTLDKTYLDMTSITSFLSIGTTATPFFGDFDGKGLIVKNLIVTSDPEDIGVFGYISSGSNVHNLTLSNLTITDKGYANILSQFYSQTNLYVFNTSAMASLMTYNTTGDTTSQTNITTTEATQSIDITSTTNTYKFIMDPSLITSNTSIDFSPWDSISYSLRSTNNDLFVISEDGATLTLNQSLLNSNTEFTTSNKTVYTRIYLTGSVVHNNARYAKILQTYTITITNNSTDNTQSISMVKDNGTDNYKYAHNTNIGLIAGHSDGSVKECYVYKGTFKLNETDSSKTSQAAESEIGLIGEVGVNINNTISPTINYDSAGDTGIINFTNIYKNIRGTDTSGTPLTTATGPNTFQLSNGSNATYYYITPGEDDLYAEYLRYRHEGTEDRAITSASNNVDFQGKKAIVEDSSYSRGLGIFQLNTANVDTSDTTSGFATGLNEFAITYNSSNTFSNIYYTTAEFDGTNGGTASPSTYYGSGKITYWGPESQKGSDYYMTFGTSIPSGTLTSAFSSANSSLLLSSRYYEKHLNYIFKVGLTDLSTNYFSGTNSKFVKDYFTYKLRDKKGHILSSNDSDFGIMVKEKVNGSYENTTSFSSYLSLSPNTTSDSFTYTDSNNVSQTAPAKSIEFSIKNDYGANVTIIASNSSTSNNYVGIYDKQYFTSDSNNYLHPSYAMYLPHQKTEDENYEHTVPIFTYDNSTKNFTSSNASIDTDSATGDSADGKTNVRLYAHTFYLPKGQYYVGSPDSTASIYYIAAQGQESQGNLGGKTPLYINADVIKDLDFLLYDPETILSDLTSGRSYTSFYAKFDSTTGNFVIDVNSSNQLTLTADNNLTSALIQNTTNKTIVFATTDGSGQTTTTTSSSTYITYNY